MIKSKLLLDSSKCDDLTPAGIWKSFEPIFGLTISLFDYEPFHKRLLKAAFESHVKQNVMIVEYRYVTG